jgi:hypothetical protein
MSHTRRLWSSLAIAAATLMTVSVPASAQPEGIGVSTCPTLDLANPSPGDRLSAGDYVVSGITFDPVTQSIAGVSRVDFFLGSRDEGGTIVGSVVPSDAPMPDHPRAFQTTLTLPDVARSDMLFAYAFSAASPATTVLGTPIEIGSVPTTSGIPATPTPVPGAVTIKNDCPTISAMPAAGAAVTTSANPVVAVNPAQGPRLQLANPNANDLLPRGTYLVYGVAFDPASQQGAGVDRVEFFLDAREDGGFHLGTGTPGANGGELGAFAARLSIPTSASGGHNIVAYAHSAITGQESVVSVPVFVGIVPTVHP